MSVLSLTAVALARDDAEAGTRTAPTKARAPQASQQTTADTLTSAIPTETLAVYTGVVGIFVASADPAAATGYLPFRWSAFGGFVVLTVAAVWLSYRRHRHRRDRRRSGFPALEALTAALAAAVWGLAMPGSPLIATLSGTLLTVTISTITLVGSACVATLSSYLTTGVAKPRAARASKRGSPAENANRAASPDGPSPAGEVTVRGADGRAPI